MRKHEFQKKKTYDVNVSFEGVVVMGEKERKISKLFRKPIGVRESLFKRRKRTKIKKIHVTDGQIGTSKSRFFW